MKYRTLREVRKVITYLDMCELGSYKSGYTKYFVEVWDVMYIKYKSYEI